MTVLKFLLALSALHHPLSAHTRPSGMVSTNTAFNSIRK